MKRAHAYLAYHKLESMLMIVSITIITIIFIINYYYIVMVLNRS